jgi:hypothetical protein
MVASLALVSGCGLEQHLADVRSFLVPPPLSRIDVGVRPLASVDAGIGNMAREAVRDALFAAQAGNRERTLVALASAKALLANTPAPAGGTLTADSLGQMITELGASTIGAETVAARLQSGLAAAGADATVLSTQTGQPNTVCCWGSPTGLGDETVAGGS